MNESVYVCMYECVCMYVCIYVTLCMYVCMYARFLTMSPAADCL
jgi:hypothetical protein